MPTRFRYQVHRHGDAAVAQATGIMRLADVATMRAALLLEHQRRALRSALVDLRRVFVSLSDDDWTAIAQQNMKAMAADLPVGILVDPAYESAAWRYCMALMQHGLTRLPFIDAWDALAWAGLPRSVMPPTRPFQTRSVAGA